jgi:hypothetical protein
MKRTLPQRLSNATLSGGTVLDGRLLPDKGASVDLNQLGQSAPNPASRQPHRERARRALAALFPDGLPDAATLSNKLLAKRVNEWLKANKQPLVEQRTIQRAAGRP